MTLGHLPAPALPTPRRALLRREARRPMLGEVLNAEEKAMQLTIDTLKDAAAWPGPDQRTLVVLASQLMAAEPYQEGHPPAELYAGRGPGQRKGNAMNTRSPCPDAEVPEISLPTRHPLTRK
jgi:hypothetical protein